MNEQTPDGPAEAVEKDKVYVTISTTEPIGFAMGPGGGGEGMVVECDEDTEALRLAADGLIKDWIALNG